MTKIETSVELTQITVTVFICVNILLSCQELTVWAYPTKHGQIKESVVCSIKDNPECVIIDFSCWGVRPELKLDSKHLHFDRILLHRYKINSKSGNTNYLSTVAKKVIFTKDIEAAPKKEAA